MAGVQDGRAAAAANDESQGDAHALRVLARTLRRYRVFLVLFTLLGAALVYAAAASVAPRYKARAVLSVDSQGEKALISLGTPIYRPELPDIETQSQMLYSPELAVRVINRLGLRDDPEFDLAAAGLLDRLAATPNMVGEASEWLRQQIGALRQLLRAAKDESAEPAKPPSSEPIDDPIVRQFLRQLRVSPIERSFAIAVEFTAENPYRAAQIANAVAEGFIELQVEAKRREAKDASDALDKWLSELKARVMQAESAIEDYREETGLTKVKDMTLSDQQLADLNSQLVAARVARMRAEAQLDLLNRSSTAGFQAASEVLGSSLIQTLRGEESGLLRRVAELSNVYGPRHPAIRGVQQELADIRGKIREEIARIAQSLRNDLATAKSREEYLTDNLRRVERQSGTLNKATIRLRELERDAEASRSFYGTTLSRVIELRLQAERASPNARIAAAAIVPEAPYFPKIAPAAAIGAFGFLLLGIGIALLREKMARGFDSSDQLERVTGLPVVALVPTVPHGRAEIVSGRYHDPFFCEALSSLHVAMLMPPPARGTNNVILVTSSVPGEGKSFLSTALAVQIARSACRCLLIDCDFRLPTAHTALGLRGDVGLLQHLTGEATSGPLIQTHDSGLDFIASGASGPRRSGERRHLAEILPTLLASPKLYALVRALSARYDLIIIDSPPALGTSDAKVLASLAGRVVYVVRWRDTARDTVISALQKLIGAAPTAITAALTQVDARRYALGDSTDAEVYARKYRQYLEQA